MRDKKSRGEAYVSRHAAQDVRRRQQYERERPDPDWESDYYDEPAPPSKKELRAQRAAVRRAKRRRFFRTLKIIMYVTMMLIIVLGGAATVGGYYVSHLETSFPNLYANGVYVGEMSREEILTALEKSGWDEKNESPLTVSLLGKAEFEIDRCLSGMELDAQSAAEAAFSFGHGSHWYRNLLEYGKCRLKSVDIAQLERSPDKNYIFDMIDGGIAAFETAMGDGSYVIDEEKSVLRVIKGAGEMEFDEEALAGAIIEALRQDKRELRWDDVSCSPTMPDYQAIFDEHSAEPVDASFSDDNRFTVIDHVVGCDFDVEEAKRLWQQAGLAEVVEVPLDIEYPQYTSEYLNSLLYRDLLGASTTYYKNSVDNRINNLNLAASKIDGLILYPGDVFSYNAILGQRTEAAGFLPAGAYENGEVVEEVGGGICQVSSTLYAAMLYGYKLTTVERYPHYFPVDYLEKGFDATVSWPTPDYKFRNDRDFPVKIVAKCDNENRALTVEIWGTNLDGCFIELRKDTYSYNNTRYPWIMEGYGVQVYRYVFDSYGMQVDQINEIYDIYHTHEATDQIKALDAAAAAQAAADANAALGVPY